MRDANVDGLFSLAWILMKRPLMMTVGEEDGGVGDLLLLFLGCLILSSLDEEEL